MVKAYCALKHVLFVLSNKVLAMHGEGEQRYCNKDPKTPQSVERKRLTWFLKLSMKNLLLQYKYNENVGK